MSRVQPILTTAAAAPRTSLRRCYLAALGWTFALCNLLRLAGYLPTIWAIWQTGDSMQHSYLTWLTWAGANLTMAAWLFEQDGRRLTCASAVCLANAVMCGATLAVIVVHRV